MSYLLVTGVGPTPPEHPSRQMAPGLRLWSLAQVASRSSCEIRIFSCDHFGHSKSTEVVQSEGITINPLAQEKWTLGLREIIEIDPPLAIVSTTDLVSAEISRFIPPEIPLWVDLYGDPIAEGQLLAERHDHNGGLAPLAANMLAILTRADRLSGCSRAHRHALLGQLGLAGRLDAANAHRDLVSVIPALLATLPQPSEIDDRLPLPPDAFTVLWSGGFNTWTDEKTLFEGIEAAMEAQENLHFICLGGGIDRHNPGTYADFEKRVAKSAHSDRFHLMGWVPQERALAITATADAAINIDATSHEAELGTRTRLLEWAAAGIPIVSTVISEITIDLANHKALRAFDVGSPQSLAKALKTLAAEPSRAKWLAEAAHNHVLNHWTPEMAGNELVEWLEKPSLAPDREPTHAAAGTNRLSRWMSALEPAMREDVEPSKDLHSDLHRLRSMMGSRLIRWARRLRNAVRR